MIIEALASEVLPSETDGQQQSETRVVDADERTAKALRDKWLAENKLLTPAGLDAVCLQENRQETSGVVAGLIPRRVVTFLVGDSGLGKSPLAYQLGLSVAAGVPFLGMKTQSGIVVMGDYENGMEESRNMCSQIVSFLKLPEAPQNFLVWSPDGDPDGSINIDRLCENAPEKLSLIIIDSLRAHDPTFENSKYAGQAMQALNKLAYRHGAAILVVHHVRKPDREHQPPNLLSEDTRVMEWFREAAGHSAILNQSHTRIAIASADGRSSMDAALVLRWYRKSKGEVGPLYLERVRDEAGEPLGFRPLAGVQLLGNAEQAIALQKLPKAFTFKEAKQVYGRTDDPTSKFLQKCISLGLVRQIDRGQYERIE
jgi:hypothetical protein